MIKHISVKKSFSLLFVLNCNLVLTYTHYSEQSMVVVEVMPLSPMAFSLPDDV